jgi:hypothetical protein
LGGQIPPRVEIGPVQRICKADYRFGIVWHGSVGVGAGISFAVSTMQYVSDWLVGPQE